MSPRWGLGFMGIPHGYKHVAPAGAKYTNVSSCLRMMFHLSPAIVGDWIASPTGWETQPLRI